MPCSRQTRSNIWPRRRAVGPARFFGRSAKGVPLSVTAVEPRCELLAPDGWKPERQSRIVGHGGCGWLDKVDRIGFNNRILRHLSQ